MISLFAWKIKVCIVERDVSSNLYNWILLKFTVYRATWENYILYMETHSVHNVSNVLFIFLPLDITWIIPKPIQSWKTANVRREIPGKMFQHLPLNGAFESRVPTFRQITEGLLLKNSLRTLRRREKIKTS